ncbi:MAG: IclR family transcriptional regulator [Acidihalobacter sp.]
MIVKTVSNAFRIIEEVSRRGELGITEICQTLSLAKSSAHDLAETLLAEGVLEKNADTKRYSLGSRLIELGNRAQNQFDIVRLAHPFLLELSEKTEETVHLTVLDNDEVLYLDCVESRLRFRMTSIIGARCPLHCTGVGKAILAYLPETEQSRIIKEKGLHQYTKNTIHEESKMRDELRKIVKQGYAIDNMEHEDFLRCVSAPIFNFEGRVFASVSVSGLAERNTFKRLSSISKLVTATADNISRRLGYTGKPQPGH